MYDQEIRPEHEREAWDALYESRRRIPVVLSSGATSLRPEWQVRDAPSPGARAAARIRGLMYPPSYIRRSLAALALYLSDEQNSERPGFVNLNRKGLDLVN